MSVRKIVLFATIPALLAACSTTKDSPIYQQSTKYKVHSPYQTQTASTQTATTSYASHSGTTYSAPTHQPVTYTTASSPQPYHVSTSSTGEVVATQVNHECLDKEGNRKLIGTALGGAAGAFAGSQIGDTKGAIIGAVAGGAAGYGIADISVDCDPIPVAAPAATTSYPSTVQPAGHHAISSTTTNTVTQQPITSTQTLTSDGYQAPTDSAYGETFGTPGYHALQANGELDETTVASTAVSAPITSAPAPTIAPSPVPAPVPYTYSTPIPAPAPAPTQIPAPTYPQYAYPQTSTPAPTPQYAQAGVTTHQVVEGDTVYSLSKRLCVEVEDIRRLNSLNSEFYIRLDDYIKLPASRC